MLPLPRLSLAIAVLVAAARAQPLLPPEQVSLESLGAFRSPPANWQIAGAIAGDPRNEKTLAGAPGKGVLLNSPTPTARGHLVTTWEHGDLDLDLEFLLPVASNSGVYLQGRYEVQLFDSWGVREPKDGDNGGIYQRWDPARGAGKEGFEGHAPRANASRAPGLWQHLHVEFEAPRFDASGKKTKNARFAKVVLNGFVIHENVEVTGPTRSALPGPESARGPLMIQGDHGPIAIRGFAVKHFGAAPIKAENLHYKLFAGDFKKVGEYDGQPPKSEGVPARFAHSAVEKSGKFALVFTGSLVVPADGLYAFAFESGGLTALAIDGKTVVTPLDRGSQSGMVQLKAGAHPFRLDFVQTANGRPSLELLAEGPGMAPHTVTMRGAGFGRGGGGGSGMKQLLVPVNERVVVQRGFVPFEPRKRLYAVSVGTPAGVHYAYDCETAAVLRVWRGPFADTFEMWDGRGNNQLAKAAGPALTFNGKPAIALIEYPQTADWPDEPEALWASQGYKLEPDGQPVFLATLADITVRDRIAPAQEGRGLVRTLQCGGKLPSWSAWVLLAEGEKITRQPNGGGWIIGDREWYIDWPADAAHQPVLRTRHGRQQLAVPLTAGTLEAPINYTIVW
ncbi:MAG TPA: family 16 glycoside hydrolase [Opitutaceae bacterium]|nr:family 16 glycoside hydrolase [Opitutaceae bacterium]